MALLILFIFWKGHMPQAQALTCSEAMLNKKTIFMAATEEIIEINKIKRKIILLGDTHLLPRAERIRRSHILRASANIGIEHHRHRWTRSGRLLRKLLYFYRKFFRPRKKRGAFDQILFQMAQNLAQTKPPKKTNRWIAHKNGLGFSAQEILGVYLEAESQEPNSPASWFITKIQQLHPKTLDLEIDHQPDLVEEIGSVQHLLFAGATLSLVGLHLGASFNPELFVTFSPLLARIEWGLHAFLALTPGQMIIGRIFPKNPTSNPWRFGWRLLLAPDRGPLDARNKTMIQSVFKFFSAHPEAREITLSVGRAHITGLQQLIQQERQKLRAQVKIPLKLSKKITH